MKTIKATLVILAILVSNFSLNAQYKQENIQKALEYAGNEYKDIIKHNMDFTKQEANAFWPILNEYLNKRNKIFNKEINLYLKDYTTLNEEEAKDFLKSLIKYDNQMDRLQKKYFRKLMKVIPTKKFLRFSQIDDFIETARDFKLSYDLPLVKG